MIYELREYHVAPGRMEDLHERFRNHTLKLFKRHGIEPIAFFTDDVGPANNVLTYLLKFEDANQRERAWASFRADPEWRGVAAASNAPGQLIHRISNRILKETDYSELD